MQSDQLNNEKKLLKALQKGDEDAFKQIFELYKDKLYSFCSRITHSDEEAEEIVHDVMLKVWLHAEIIKPDLHFSSWLFTITKNASINFLKKRAMEASRIKQVSFYTENTSNDAEELVDLEEYEKVVHDAVEHLPPQRKLIFLMSREDNLTHEQIAEQLGISKNTVRNQITEATKSIKNYFLQHSDLTICTIILINNWQ